MLTLKDIAQIIIEGEIDIAKSLLEKITDNEDACHWLSLIYRYFQNYEQEGHCMIRAAELYPNNVYFKERLLWKNLNLSEKLTNRKTISSITDGEKAAITHDLRKTSIISGCDANYFHFLEELLESLSQLKIFNVCDIGILDCGMTDAQLKLLRNQYSIQNIQKAEWVVPRKTDNMPEGYKAIMNKPYLHKYFPNYEYLIWLDADTWVQDEMALYRLLRHSFKHGIGISRLPNGRWKGQTVTGFFCVKKNSEIAKQWITVFEERCRNGGGFAFSAEEHALTAAMKKVGIYESLKFIPGESLFCVSHQGFPYLVEGKEPLLFAASTGKPLEVYAYDHLIRKDKTLWPILKVKNPLNISDFHSYYQKSLLVLQKQKQDNLNTIKFWDGQVLESLSFKTWPWEERKTIKQTLKKECKKHVQKYL